MEFSEAPLHAKDGVQASDQRIQQFIDAWKVEFGEELSEAEARIRLNELVDFYCLVARPLPAANDDS